MSCESDASRLARDARRPSYRQQLGSGRLHAAKGAALLDIKYISKMLS